MPKNLGTNETEHPRHAKPRATSILFRALPYVALLLLCYSNTYTLSNPTSIMDFAPEEPQKKGKFEPKIPVVLDPPKDDPISLSTLLKCNGVDTDKVYVAIKGKVFDVTGNKAYLPGGSYHGTCSSLCSSSR